jgi:hypothetical protein
MLRKRARASSAAQSFSLFDFRRPKCGPTLCKRRKGQATQMLRVVFLRDYPFAACPCTTIGLTSIEPTFADGILLAISIASSRFFASIM